MEGEGLVSPFEPFTGDIVSRLSGQNTNMLTISDVAFLDGARDFRCSVSLFGELIGFDTAALTTRRKPVCIIEGVTCALICEHAVSMLAWF